MNNYHNTLTGSKAFLYFCLSFGAGIFLSSFFTIPKWLVLLFLLAGVSFSLFFLFFLPKKKILAVIGLCLVLLVIGIWRHSQVESGIKNNELGKFNDLDQKITLIGTVCAEPDVRDKNTKLTIKPKEIKFENGSRTIEGKVLVSANRYPEYQYNDTLKIFGKLKTPHIFENFNYKDYLAKDGIYSVIYYPKIELIGKNDGELFSVVFAKILGFKNKLRNSIYQNLSPPQSTILGAMILGDKTRLSTQLKEKLNIAGVRHITAVSGMHVAILMVLLMILLISLGFWRKQALCLTLIFIILFIVMTGLQTSAIRAGIMGGLFIFAQYLGRLNTSSRAIIFAAAVMLAINPLLLRLDVGFQLSFLAMLGIIYLMPIFQNWLRIIPAKFLRDILSMTLAAQVFTLPILIYNFGYMSLVAPLTNILIVPLLPFVLGLGFLFGLTGMLLPFLGWLFSLPCWLFLTYVILIIDRFSGLPFASLTLQISWLWLLSAYLILGYITWQLNKKQRLKFLNY